jgi:hypothetical protein
MHIISHLSCNVLQNGVRALMLDTYDFKGDVWLCHSVGGKCNDFTAFVSATTDCSFLTYLQQLDLQSPVYAKYVVLIVGTCTGHIQGNRSISFSQPIRNRHGDRQTCSGPLACKGTGFRCRKCRRTVRTGLLSATWSQAASASSCSPP